MTTETERKVDVTGERLKSFVERIEKLQGEKDDLSADIKDVFTEAASTGFDVKIMRLIIKLRKLDANDRQEQEALLETYKAALGIV